MNEQVIIVNVQWSEHWWRTRKTGYWVCGHCGLTWPLLRVRVWDENMEHYEWEDVDAYPDG